MKVLNIEWRHLDLNKKIDETKIKSFETSHKKRQKNKPLRGISKTTIVIITIIFIVIVASISIYFLSNFKNSNEQNDKKSFFVSINGKGNYSSIQEAIDSASNNDSIYVSNGTYFENIIITKSIDLFGEDKNSTIIDGNSSGTVIHILADFVKISGFTITNINPTSQNEDDGIKIGSNYNTISDCNISSNSNYGLYLGENTKNNIIKYNIFYNNKYSIYANNAKTNDISSNTFTSSADYGLYFDNDSNDNLISDNIFTENNYTIRIRGSEKNTIFKNLIMNNKYGLYLCCGAKNNLAYNNFFINNSNWNAIDALVNKWDNGIVGNYWDDYSGPDANGDGIGDIPYLINDNRVDRFPLMQPK